MNQCTSHAFFFDTVPSCGFLTQDKKIRNQLILYNVTLTRVHAMNKITLMFSRPTWVKRDFPTNVGTDFHLVRKTFPGNMFLYSDLTGWEML